MLRKTAIVLWSLVLVAVAWWLYTNRQLGPDAAVTQTGDDGRVFRDVSWNHFPAIPPFRLIDQSDEAFDSASLSGRPYVVSFFFTSCPTICRDLNRQIKRLAEQFRHTELTFLSITVDPEKDRPGVLQDYADSFQADTVNWRFLTGQLFRVREIGEQRFGVVVDPATHTGDILLIDRWGRYRDRFTWDDPREMKRFADVARAVLAETQPPIDASFTTRNVLAGISHHQLPRPPVWLDAFHLTDQNNQRLFSRDLTGTVWIASFFFTSCPGICPKQNAFLLSLQPALDERNVPLVSITTDPQTDEPRKLRQYARQLGAGSSWTFLTGPREYIARVGSEYLGLMAHGEHHSSMLVIVDRWSNVRARIDWQQIGARQMILEIVDQLRQETAPPADFQLIGS